MTVVDDVRTEVDELDRKAREFFATVDRVLSSATTAPAGAPVGPVLLSPDLVTAIREGLRRVQEALQAVFDRFAQLLEQPGDPESLRQAARGWTAIGNGLGTTAGAVGLDRMSANVEWDGSAADAYRAMVPAQADRLTAMKTQCLALSASLYHLADQIESFWLALAAAAVAMGLAAAIAIVTAMTVVGIPAACGALLTAVTGGAALITTTVLQMEALTDRIATEQRGMTQSLDEVGAAWPAPRTAALADASVADGDGSEWRPNR